MTYTKREDLAGRPGETVVALDDGHLVAISCARKLLGNRISFHVLARAIDTAGAPLRDAGGEPIEREFKFSADVGTDADEMARQCLLAALGEPTTLPLGPMGQASHSIRVALAAAPVAGAVDAGAML